MPNDWTISLPFALSSSDADNIGDADKPGQRWLAARVPVSQPVFNRLISLSPVT